MKKYSFEKLEVWSLVKDLSILIYKITNSFPDEKKYEIISQLRRASIFICNKLAEGSACTNKKDKAHFTQIVYGSLLEVLNLLIISNELEFIIEADLLSICEKIELISK